MENPFQVISERLSNVESLLLDLKNGAFPNALKNKDSPNARVVDLDGLIKARPFIGSRSTIYKKVSRGEIPHSKSGKRLIFDLNAIDKWLLSNSIKTNIKDELGTGFSLRGRKRKRRS